MNGTHTPTTDPAHSPETGNRPPTAPTRHLLVFADRDVAEEVAEEFSDRFGAADEPQVVREALAGEDDAEDAQWLVVVEGARTHHPGGDALRALAEEYDGWLEVD